MRSFLIMEALTACTPATKPMPTDTGDPSLDAESGLPINCQPWMHLAAVTCDDGAACVELSRLDRACIQCEPGDIARFTLLTCRAGT